MKKNIIAIIIIISLFYYVLTNNTLISNNLISSINLFYYKVFPNLFIFIILSKLLINYNFPYYIYKLFKSSYLYIFLIGLFSTTPTNTYIIKNIYQKKLINSNTATIYIMSSFFLNPLFLYSILNNIFNYKIALKLIMISYLTNIILYLLFKNNDKIIPIKTREEKLSDCLIDIIKDIFPISFNILAMIIIFSLISIFLPNRLIALKGILEVTNGLNLLLQSNYSNLVKEVLALIYINFGGICLLMQVKSVIKDTLINFNDYVLSRFYACIISSILFLVIHFLTSLFL